MSFKQSTFVFALAATMSVPVEAWAFGGGGGAAGCSNLPEYARAAGTLEGLSSCDMTIEQARRIVAAHDGYDAYAQTAPAQHRHRRYKIQTPQQ